MRRMRHGASPRIRSFLCPRLKRLCLASVISVYTEITVENGTAMVLTNATREFILHWGEMGSRWGVNRTVAQVHALLYLSAEPLTAEDIAEALSVARSNVGTSLRELQNWQLVQATHQMGDRREFFSTSEVVRPRAEREIEPTIATL